MGQLKLDVEGQGGGRISGVDGEGGRVECLENWTIFMDVICVSFFIIVVLIPIYSFIYLLLKFDVRISIC